MKLILRSLPFVLLVVLLTLTIAALAGQKGSKVTSITIEHTPCYGTCPVWKAVLKPDGSVVYTGEAHAPRVGKFTGQFFDGSWEHLVTAADMLDIYHAPRYGRPIRDVTFTIITIVRGGKTYVTQHSGGDVATGPWAFGRLVDSVVGDVSEFKKVR